MQNLFKLALFYISTFFIYIFPSSTHTEGVVGQPQSFFPSQAESQIDKTISSLVYRGLLKYDQDGLLVGDLAEEWKISEDGLAYTVKIKPNQYWSQGIEITSDDLIYTAFKLPEFSDVATDKIDKYTVRYILPNKFSPFLSLLTIGVMQANTEEKQNPLMPISNGDFQVISVKRDGPAVKQITLQNKNKDASFKKLVFRYYSNEAELITAAKLGEIDSFSLSYSYDLEGFSHYQIPITSVYYSLLFNLENPKFESDNFRLKLAQVLPIDELLNDLGIPTQGPISYSEFTNTKLNFDKYAPNFVPEFLNEEVSIIVPDVKHQKDLANQIAKIWEEKLGLRVVVLPMNPDGIRESIVPSKNFEILLYGQQIGRDPDRYVNWHSTQSEFPGLNITGFNQVRADRALEEGRKILEKEERRIHYDDFQANIMEHMPAIFLYHPYLNYYVSNRTEVPLKAFDNKIFNPWDRFSNFSEWKRRFIN